MPRRAVLALLVCLPSLACTATSSGDAEEPKPAASEPAKRVEDPEPEQADPPRAAISADALPDCPADPEPLIVYCTEANKLAGQWGPVDRLEVPDDVEIIFHVDDPAPPQASLLIGVRGDELYVKLVACGACRRVLGDGFSGHLSHMSEAQIRELQTRLGLADELPLLATTEEWKSFCSDERGKAALTQIAAAEQHGR